MNTKEMKLLSITIKLMLAVLFLSCIGRMPYGYYQFVKSATFFCCLAIAYMEWKDNNYIGVIIAAVFISFFNPLFRVTFKRDVWQFIDKVSAAIFIAWVILDIVMLLRKPKKG